MLSAHTELSGSQNSKWSASLYGLCTSHPGTAQDSIHKQFHSFSLEGQSSPIHRLLQTSLCRPHLIPF